MAVFLSEYTKAYVSTNNTVKRGRLLNKVKSKYLINEYVRNMIINEGEYTKQDIEKHPILLKVKKAKIISKRINKIIKNKNP